MFAGVALIPNLIIASVSWDGPSHLMASYKKQAGIEYMHPVTNAIHTGYLYFGISKWFSLWPQSSLKHPLPIHLMCTIKRDQCSHFDKTIYRYWITTLIGTSGRKLKRSSHGVHHFFIDNHWSIAEYVLISTCFIK